MKETTAYRKLFKHRKRWKITIKFGCWRDYVTVAASPSWGHGVPWPHELGDADFVCTERGIANAMSRAANEINRREEALRLYKEAKAVMRKRVVA